MEALLIPDEKLKQFYSAMLKCRVLHEHAAPASNRRSAARAAAGIGYEAALVGCAIDLQAEDVIASSHRGLIADFILNLPFGNTRGKSRRGAATNGSVAALARCAELRTGIAMAKKMKGKPSPAPKSTTGNIVVTFAGSASGSPAKSWSADAWSEALGVAGRDSLPIIFVQRTTIPEPEGQPSTQSRRSRQTGKNGAALLAGSPSHGVSVIPVDGNDAIAVYRVAHESIRRARHHGGPTLIECLTYQLDGQGIDAAAEDPIAKMELYLSRKGLFPRGWKSRLLRQFSSELSNGRTATASAPPKPRSAQR